MFRRATVAPGLRLACHTLGLGLIVAMAPMVARASIADVCGAIVDQMEREKGIPPGLLHAVALAESGRWQAGEGFGRAWPWTVRSGPDSFFLPSKEVALGKVRELRAAGRTNIDVGCMQINLGHHGEAFASMEEAFDPVTNVAYGARFLKQLHEQSHSWAEATGRYHNADPERGQAYRARVYRLWWQLRRRQGGASPGIVEASFVGDRLLRVVGNSATPPPGDGATARLITPILRDGGMARILRGR
jgi:Transglycosylase SLT domain